MTNREDKIIRVARSWIGTPYRHQASVIGQGCDCLGLLRGVWRDVVGAEPEGVPSYTPDWSEMGREERLWAAAVRNLEDVPVNAAKRRAGGVVSDAQGSCGQASGYFGGHGGGLCDGDPCLQRARCHRDAADGCVDAQKSWRNFSFLKGVHNGDYFIGGCGCGHWRRCWRHCFGG